MKLKKRVSVTVAVVLAVACPHMAFAGEMFKSSEFLKLDQNTQEFYIRTSIGMLSLVVGQSNEQDSKCIQDWYFTHEKESNSYIFETMKRFPDYHPKGVILAVAEKKCRKFIYK